MTKRAERKVAFVATVYRHLESFHLPYMKWYLSHGYKVHAYAARDAGREGVGREGVVLHDLPFSRNPFHKKNWTSLKKLKSSFEQENYELVHLHTPVAAAIGRIAARRAKVRVVIYTAHGFHFHRGSPLLNWLLFYPLERGLSRWTDYLITINEEDYRRARKFPVRMDVLFIPGVGLNTEFYRPQQEQKVRERTRKELGLCEKDFVISCVAELNGNKNQMQLIRAVELILPQHPVIKCLLVGEGQAKDQLAQYLVKNGLQNEIKLLGFRRDIPELLAATDLVALFSKREGLPRILMEAMAAGKPIVATDIRGNRDLVRTGENGVLVPVADVAATSQAFLFLLSHSELREQMGRNSQKMAKKYDIETILDQMQMVYRKSTPDLNEMDTKHMGARSGNS